MKGIVKISSSLLLVLMVSVFILSALVIPEGIIQDEAPAYTVAGAPSYVKSGQTMLINADTTYTLSGTLVVESGATLYICGTLDAKSGSMIMNNGTIRIYEGGLLRLGGYLCVAKDAQIRGLGTLQVLNRFDDINCVGTVRTKIDAPEPVTKNGITTVGGVLIVNKQYSIPKTYGDGLDADAYSAFLKMKEASGYDTMSIISGFRSYEKQESTFAYWCSVDGYEVAKTYSAEPGHSEHQTGLAMDITSLNQSYGKTAEGKWLAAHCHEYGFIIRYPKGKSDITGYMYEPWHVRYLGSSTAKLVYDSGLTLEEFLGVA